MTMQIIPRPLFALALAWALTACTITQQLRIDYFPTPPADLPHVAGRAVIAMPAALEARMHTLQPQSVHGRGTDTAVPVDSIVKQAAIAAFGPVLDGGVISTSDVEAAAGRDFVIEPTVQGFSFRYGLTPITQFTPYVALSVRVVVRDAVGAVLLDRNYSSDYEARDTNFLFMPNERMSQTLHIIAFELVNQAARDFAAVVGKNTPSAAATR